MTYWLDPARDYMPERSKYRTSYKNTDNGGAHAEVLDAKQIDGVWVPMQIVRRNLQSDKSTRETEYDYKVQSFDRAPIADKDLEVQFPLNIHVLDSDSSLPARHAGAAPRLQLLPAGVEALHLRLRQVQRLAEEQDVRW